MNTYALILHKFALKFTIFHQRAKKWICLYFARECPLKRLQGLNGKVYCHQTLGGIAPFALERVGFRGSTCVAIL